MPTCVPIKDLRDTAAFDELVDKSPTPITVTKNGYDRFVCMRSRDYENLVNKSAEAQLLARIEIMEYERKHGLAEDAYVVTERIMDKYGL